MPAHDSTEALGLLRDGDVELVGRMVNSSNATFLVTVSDPERPQRQTRAIYKPLRGERPLWDFEPGLHRREAAAWELSVSLGLELVPPTVLRDGPFGEGSFQLYIDADPRHHYFNLFEERPDLHDALRDFAFFDIIANNTDRKGGHLLVDADDHVWGIDHGVCFAADFKLRTVIWEFAGEPIPARLLAAAEPLAESVPLHLAVLLSDDEVEALRERVAWVLDDPVFPVDHSGRRYPWPLV